MVEQLKKATAILRRKTVQARTGLSRSSIYGMMKDPSSEFPQSIKISARAVGWLESDIDDFIASKIAASLNHTTGGK
ncbi:MAG TPA: AlpA family phage regulatory protein [Gallionella sp.]|nr:AlpA family phage regulatory protein [Gallionella sp.]